MSKLLISLALAPTKAPVNAYTWSTLPFYAAAQRPWTRLRQSKSFGLRSTIDASGRVIYSRPSPNAATVQNPILKCYSFNEIIPLLNRNRKVIGIRDVFHEELAQDPNGNLVKVDGRPLKKLTLADEFKWLTVGEVLDRVDALARGFQQLGIKAGERVCIFAENSLEWVCTSFALHRINAVSVTLLSILNNEGLAFSIKQSEARYLVTSQDLLTTRVQAISDQLQTPLNIVYIENKQKLDDESLVNCTTKLKAKNYQISTYSEIQQNGYKIPPFPFPNAKSSDPALIMFTSGTTGNPKGVVFTHRQIAEKLHNYVIYDRELEEPMFRDRVHLAYLPMSHIMGYLLNFCLFIFDGRMAVCTPATLMDSSPVHVKGQLGDISLVQPDYIISVPLMLERFMKEIYRKLGERGKLAEPLFTYFMDYKIRWRSRGFDTPIINRLISKKFNQQFGGRLRAMLVGSAPLNQRTEALIQAALNVNLIQGYGTSETSGGSHLTHEKDISYGSVGVPYHSVQFYLKDWADGGYHSTDKPNPRGEIVIGGEIIAQGYYKLPEETKEAFHVDENGTRWFSSGDIGELLPNGTLKIIDRKKDLTKLANGEFVSLGKIESGLRTSQFIENICVITDPYCNYVTALITPNRRALSQLAADLSKSSLPFEQLIEDDDILASILSDIRKIGKQLAFSAKELPVKIKLVKEEWSQDNNLLTPAMKLKRKQVNNFYEKEIKQLFGKN